MPTPLDRAAVYQAALLDLVEAAKVARGARDRRICGDVGVEQLLRDELAWRWQTRIERGELPPCFNSHMVMTVTEAAAAFFRAPAHAESL